VAHVRTSLAWALAPLALLFAAPAPAFATADPLLSDQWALADPGLGAREAWTQSLGDGVIVAILDSGVQFDHPDLAANLWTNGGEIPGNGIDDDRNGFVDDVHGVNLVDPGGSATDADGHGTHVAGIVAAVAGNGIGGSGLAPRARIMSVLLSDPDHGCTAVTLARGIRYAVDEGARILNVSMNGDITAPELDAAIRYAGTHGATIVASAGNNGRDIDLRPSFPAASADPAVLSVAATGRRGGLVSFSNRGPRNVDLAAPGDSIVSTAIGSSFEDRSGTSMAAPYVAGALALLAAARPDLNQGQLRNVLRATARRSSKLRGMVATGGLDVGAAMHALLPGTRWRPAPETSKPRVQLAGSSAVRAGRVATLRWSATNAESVVRWRVYLGAHRIAARARPPEAGLRRRVPRPGSYRWKVVGVDAAGSTVVSATRMLRVAHAA
jgi:subtilisin family serine protease